MDGCCRMDVTQSDCFNPGHPSHGQIAKSNQIWLNLWPNVTGSMAKWYCRHGHGHVGFLESIYEYKSIKWRISRNISHSVQDYGKHTGPYINLEHYLYLLYPRCIKGDLPWRYPVRCRSWWCMNSCIWTSLHHHHGPETRLWLWWGRSRRRLSLLELLLWQVETRTNPFLISLESFEFVNKNLLSLLCTSLSEPALFCVGSLPENFQVLISSEPESISETNKSIRINKYNWG